MVKSQELILSLLRLVDRNTDPHTGFLPQKTPLETLPKPYEKITYAAAHFVQHYHGENKNVRPWLEEQFREVPVGWLEAVHDLTDHETEALMTKLSLLCHAYRWQMMPTLPELYSITHLTLPQHLESLWFKVAERMNVPRVGIFYTMITCNWRLPQLLQNQLYDPKDLQYGKIEIINPWLQGQEFNELYTFITTALEMEAQGIYVLRSITKILEGILDKNDHAVEFGFQDLNTSILKIYDVFNKNIKMERMKPGNFLKLIQPTMIWLMDNIEGANGPQCCTIQLIDSFLGVPRESSIGEMITKSRHYMLPKHRKLLDQFDQVGELIRRYVMTGNNPKLQQIYSECLATMVGWRISHQKRGGHYLKGEADKPVDHYTSTGLMVKTGVNRVEVFETAMQAHIDQTKKQILGAKEHFTDSASEQGVVFQD